MTNYGAIYAKASRENAPGIGRDNFDAGVAAVVAAAKAEVTGELREEFSFDYETFPGTKYVTTNPMMAETMAAGKPGAKLLRRMAPA